MSAEYVWVKAGDGRQVLVPANEEAEKLDRVGQERTVRTSIADYIPKKERDLIYEQSGIHVDSRSDMKRKFGKSKRVLEKGEPGDRMRRDIQEWNKAGGESSGVRAPEMADYDAPKSRPCHLDMRRLFKENLERAKAKYRS